MGSRTRRLVFLRLMAVVAICFMAIGHLLYSMTVGLDGYARMHMAVIAPSATSHKDLQDLMSNGAGAASTHQQRMRQKHGGKGKNGAHLPGCTTKTPHSKGDQCRLRFEATGGNGKIRGSYSIKPVNDAPWDIQRLPFKDISALNAHVRVHNASLVHVRHCPHLRLQQSLVEASKASATQSPWQPTSRDARSYVFSAFYDGRSQPPPGVRPGSSRGSVKVIGVGDVEAGHRPAFCQLWFMEDDASDEDIDDGLLGMSRSPLVVPVTAYPLSDPSSSRFSAFLYTCELPTRRPPVGVSLVPEACRPATNYLPVVRHQAASRVERGEFSVCVPALEAHYADTDGLLQMMEVNRMFGADRFIFYNQSTGSDVGDHLRSYVGDNLAVVLPYGAPEWLVGLRGGEISADWQRAARLAGANDCLYRNMFRSEFVVFLDVDEVLVPRGHRKWVDMLDDVSVAASVDHTREGRRRTATRMRNQPPPGVGAAGAPSSTPSPPAFYFKTVAFRTDRADDTRYAGDRKVQQLRITGLLKTDRELIQPLTPGKLRYIVRPLQIYMLSDGGLSPIGGQGVAGLPVPESKGLVHVYRPGAGLAKLPQPRRPTVKDKVLLPYYDVIIARILERHERIENPIT